MKLGMNMLLWSTDVSGPEYDEVFAMLKNAGYDGVEVPIFDREVDKYAELGARLDALGLERLAVAARGPDDNPTATDSSAAVEATKSNLDSAAALGAPRSAARSARRSACSPAHPRPPRRRRAPSHISAKSRRMRRSAGSRSRSST